MRRIASLILLIIVAAIALAPSAYRYWSYYEILPWERQPERPAPPSFSAEEVADVIKPEQGEFVDEPEMGEGLILLDVAHDNQFQLEEIGPLDGRLAARGYEFINYTGGDLSRQLRGVSAFVAIAPLADYDQDEIEALTDFVARGGRLLMMGDPARFDVEYIEDDFGFIVDFRFNTNEIPLNSLANEFDLTFEGDYLYDLTRQNEGNFRNIVIEDDHMSASPLTDNLDAVALYGSHSIRVGSQGETLLAGSDNVYSSATDRAGGLSLAAVSHDNQVMAIGDINFMGEPYFASLDNMRFIANIADFLVGSAQRDYLLTDFPYFYQDQIDLLYVGDVDLGADAFDEIIVLQDGFRDVGKKLTLTTEPQETHDTLYLGLYNQANTETITAMLEAAGITLVIDPPVLTEDELKELEEAEEAAMEEAEAAEDEETAEEETADDMEEEEEEIEVIQQIQSTMGNVQMRGTALILFNQTDGRNDIVILAASKEGLENTVARLLDLMPLTGDYSLDDCLTTSTMALCPTDVDDEEVEAELLTGSEPPQAEEEMDEPEDDEGDVEEPADDNDDIAEPEDDEGDDGDIEEPEDDNGDQFTIDDLEPAPTMQGDLGLDETVEDSLDADESHGWTYVGEAATVTIFLEADEDFDGILELFDADGVSVEYADSTFEGENETLEEVAIDDGYIIVVSDYFFDGGSYALSVTAVEGEADEPADDENGDDNAEEPEEPEEPTDPEDPTEPEEPENPIDPEDPEEPAEPEDPEEPIDPEEPGGEGDIASVFLYIDDNGEFLGPDETAVVDIAAILGEAYEVTTWTVSEQDTPLTSEELAGHDLVIWNSSLYREVDADFDEDALIILEYALDGNALLVIGATPPWFEPVEISELSDIEFVGDDEILLDGFTAGEVIELEFPVQAAVIEETAEDADPDTEFVFVIRGPNSENSSEIVSLGILDEFSESRIGFLLLPLEALTTDVQDQFINNFINWFNAE